MCKKHGIGLGMCGASMGALFGWYAYQYTPLFHNRIGRALFVGIAALLAVMAMLAYYGIFVRRMSMARAIMILLLLFGGISMVINTPGSVPDERSHLASVYLHSNRLLGWPEAEPVQGEQGLYRNVMAPVRRGDQTDMDWDIRTDELIRERTTESAYRYILFKTGWFCRGEAADPVFVQMRDINAPATGYFPAILGLSVGRVLGLGLYPSLMLARLCQLLFYVLAVWWAVRRTPVGKNAMMLCALLPNCLHLAPSLSYDSVILALGFALIAQLLYLAYGTIEKVDVKNILLTALLAAVLAPSKYACYLVAALLVFLIPHERFSRKRGRTLFFLLLIAIGLASLLLFHADALAMALGKDVWIPRDASRYDEGGYNITLVLQHPLKVIWLILYTAVSGARDLVLGMAGKTLGFSAIQIDLWIIDGFLLCLLAARLCQRDELRRNYCRRERRILLLPLPLCLLFFLFGMLLWETGFDSDRIAGVQGRYLLPLLPAAMLAIPPFSLQICGAEDVCDPGKRVSWRHLLLTAVILQSAAVLNQLAQVLAK